MNDKFENGKPMVYVIVDNLKIGGIQRLALDECYFFKNAGVETLMIVLDSISLEDSIITTDGKYFTENHLDTLYIGQGIFRKIWTLTNIIRKSKNKSIFVSHSASGVVLAKLASIFALKRIKILLWIHQVITLSDKIQAYKRILYSLFANNIYFGAKQFQSEWIRFLNSHRIIKIFYKKKTEFSRIGVYINRVIWNKHELFQTEKNSSKNIVFASRLTSWKGLKTFEKVSKELLNDGYETIIMTANNSGSVSVIKKMLELNEFTVVLDKCPSNLRGINNLVHIYPTNYGVNTSFPQSIGLNVLEFLLLGIPSVISEESFETFPELKNSILIEVCNWNDISQVRYKTDKLASLSLYERRTAALSLHKAISIEFHGNMILNQMKG